MKESVRDELTAILYGFGIGTAGAAIIIAIVSTLRYLAGEG